MIDNNCYTKKDEMYMYVQLDGINSDLRIFYWNFVGKNVNSASEWGVLGEDI